MEIGSKTAERGDSKGEELWRVPGNGHPAEERPDVRHLSEAGVFKPLSGTNAETNVPGPGAVEGVHIRPSEEEDGVASPTCEEGGENSRKQLPSLRNGGPLLPAKNGRKEHCPNVSKGSSEGKPRYTAKQLQRSYQNGFDTLVNQYIELRMHTCGLGGMDDAIICDELYESKKYITLGRTDAKRHIGALVLSQQDPGYPTWPYDGVLLALTDAEMGDEDTRLEYNIRSRRCGRREEDNTVRAVRPGDYFIVARDRSACLSWKNRYDRKLPIMCGEVVIFLESVNYDDRHPKAAMKRSQKKERCSGERTLYLVQACGGRIGLVPRDLLTTPWFLEGEKYPSCFKKGLPPLFSKYVAFPVDSRSPSLASRAMPTEPLDRPSSPGQTPPTTEVDGSSNGLQGLLAQKAGTNVQSNGAQPTAPTSDDWHTISTYPTDTEDDESKRTHQIITGFHEFIIPLLDVHLINHTRFFDGGKLADILMQSYSQRAKEVIVEGAPLVPDFRRWLAVDLPRNEAIVAKARQMRAQDLLPETTPRSRSSHRQLGAQAPFRKSVDSPPRAQRRSLHAWPELEPFPDFEDVDTLWDGPGVVGYVPLFPESTRASSVLDKQKSRGQRGSGPARNPPVDVQDAPSSPKHKAPVKGEPTLFEENGTKSAASKWFPNLEKQMWTGDSGPNLFDDDITSIKRRRAHAITISYHTFDPDEPDLYQTPYHKFDTSIVNSPDSISQDDDVLIDTEEGDLGLRHDDEHLRHFHVGNEHAILPLEDDPPLTERQQEALDYLSNWASMSGVGTIRAQGRTALSGLPSNGQECHDPANGKGPANGKNPAEPNGKSKLVHLRRDSGVSNATATRTASIPVPPLPIIRLVITDAGGQRVRSPVEREQPSVILPVLPELECDVEEWAVVRDRIRNKGRMDI